MLEAAWSLHCPVSHKPTHHHLKVLKGNILEHDIMLSFIPVGVQMEYIVHSRKWLAAPVHVFDNTCCFMSPNSGRKCRNSLWVSSPRGYEKFTLQARSIGGNRQTAACLITGSILISLFYLPPWIEAEGLTASEYFPRDAPVGSPPLLILNHIQHYWLSCEFPDCFFFFFFFISVIVFPLCIWL